MLRPQAALHVPGRVLHVDCMRVLWQPITNTVGISRTDTPWPPSAAPDGKPPIMVGRPYEPLSVDLCQRLGVPLGTAWGANASEMMQIQMGKPQGFTGAAQPSHVDGGLMSSMYGSQRGMGQVSFASPY
jgi:hypothetical protein